MITQRIIYQKKGKRYGNGVEIDCTSRFVIRIKMDIKD